MAVLAGAALLVGLAGGARWATADYESARRFFAENVRSSDWKARRSGYGAFEDHDGTAAAKAILDAAGAETHPAVLAAAAATLGRMRSGDARGVAVAALKGGKWSARLVAAQALATMRGPDADAALVAGLSDGNATIAQLCATALATKGRAGAVEGLVAALASNAPSVRAAAARSLGALGDRAAVAPLAARLKVEKGRARSEVVAALEAVTGKAYGDAPAAWESVAAGEEPAEVKATPPLTFFGAPVTGDRIVFVLDRSLQMTDAHGLAKEEKRDRLAELCAPKGYDRIPWRQLKTRMQLAQAHIRHVVGNLPASARFEVIYFAEDVAGVFGKKFVPPNTASKKTLDDVFAKLQTDDGINVWEALMTAFDLGGATEDRALKGGPEQIFLVLNNLPTKGDVTDPDPLERGVVFKARVRGVAVHVVDMGANPQILADRLAKGTGGTYLDLTK